MKLSVANAAKSKTESPSQKKMMKKWRDILPESDDSFQDIMKQELNLVDSFDTDLSDYETELKIPMLKDSKGKKFNCQFW